MRIILDHNSPIPLYLQIEEQIRKEIRKSEYKKGKKLPNEAVLAQQLGISRSTLRQAINVLVQKGLLIRRKVLEQLFRMCLLLPMQKTG